MRDDINKKEVALMKSVIAKSKQRDKERENKKYQFKTTGIPGTFTCIVFAVMKLMGAVEWSWTVVFMPLVLAAVVIFIIAIVSGFFVSSNLDRYL